MNSRADVHKLLFPVKLGHFCLRVTASLASFFLPAMPLLGLAMTPSHRTLSNESPGHPKPWQRTPFPLSRGAFVTLSLSLAQCGYAPAYGGERPSQQLTVNAAPSLAPESGALAAVLSGLRQELSRSGALRPGSGYPRAVVELLRVDERGAGMAVQPGQPSATPLARGALVGVTARAWVIESPGARPYRDTGDVRRVTTVATGISLVDDVASHDDAIQMAGVSTGKALGRRVLGEVEPAMEPL